VEDKRSQELAQSLGELIGPQKVLAGPTTKTNYANDAYTVDHFPPLAVTLPETTEEVAKVVRWCNHHQIPFTPRGAGTGLSGGAMPALGGVVISTKKLTKILFIEPENSCLLAQAGVANLKLSQAVAQWGLHFAPDPSSQSVATLGGNIAENSGGPHTLKYGVTAPHILGLTFVDAKGDIQYLGGKVPGLPGYDLLSLMIGSEGTLGIVTEAWIKLTPLPEATETLLASFPSPAEACRTVSAIIRAGILPAALEMMDANILVAVKAAFSLDVIEGTGAMLLIETDGDPATAAQERDQILAICQEQGALKVELAANAEERAKLWTARKKGVGAMGRLAPTIVTHDGVIPPSRLPEMLEEVYRVADEAGVGVANLFHAGDGNLHPIFYFDSREPGKIEAVVEAGEKIIRRCLELGGSVTGEHGVGVEKAGLLEMMFDSPSLVLQKKGREIFHESELCNPCKIIPDARGCTEHKVRWRGAAT
jgi:glycolate oxidase